MSDKENKRKRSCPLRSNMEECCEELCEWYIINEKYLKGKGLCAVTLSGFSALLIQDIEKKI